MFGTIKTSYANWSGARLQKKAAKGPSKFAPVKTGVQKFGNILSGCIMPVIGVIIAWGIATAFFIPAGWTPVSAIDTWVVGPTVTYIIPVLIGFMGGYNVYKIRGGMMGAFVTMCVVGGVKAFQSGLIYDNVQIVLNGKVLNDLGPQFLGAMIVGPLSAFILKKTEALWSQKIPAGFEMLVNNFYFGFAALVMGAVAFYDMVFVAIAFNYVFGVIINWLTGWNGLPLTSLLVEPAKPLFLNNAINHGVFTPLGEIQAQGGGKSILFLIESNPGPGMGMLLGILLFDKNKMNKGQAGAASVIHFFGGIHEVYFPFIIARPWLLLSTTFGGAFGVAMFQAFGVGARSPVSPGSVISEYTFVNSSGLDYAGLSVGIFGAIAVSMLITFILFKTVYRNEKKAMSMAESIAIMNARKGSQSRYVNIPVGAAVDWAKVNFIAFVCDAGMGSSALGANIVRKEIKKEGLSGIDVRNFAITSAPEDAQVIVVQKELASRVRALKLKAYVYEIDQFLDKKGYEQLLANLKQGRLATTGAVVPAANLNVAGAQGAVTELMAEQTIPAVDAHLNGAQAALHEVTIEQPAPTEGVAKPKVNRLFRTEAGKYDQNTILPAIAELLFENNVAKDKDTLLATLKDRAAAASLYMGNGMILPHPTESGRGLIEKELILTQWFQQPFEYDGNTVNFAVTLALKGDSHMDELAGVAETFGSSEALEKAVADKNEAEIRRLLNA